MLFPVLSSSGNQVLDEYTLPGGQCILSPSWFQPLSLLWVPHLRCALCLLWGPDLWLWPSWWMSTIQDPRKTWLATRSLLMVWLRMHLWGWDFPSPTSSGCRPPASLPTAGGWACLQLASSPLYLLSPLFSEQAQQFLRLEFFTGKLSFFSLWLSHSLGCYLLLAPSDCPQGIQAQSLP